MMKKLIVAVAAVGAVTALRPVLKRRIIPRMREHGTRMAAHCREMTGAHPGGQGETSGDATVHQKMREHCEPTVAHDADRAEPIATA